MKYVAILFGLVAILSCRSEKERDKEWVWHKTISLENVSPIGLAIINDTLWLSDGDHNRVVQIDTTGNILKTIDSLSRPMHVAAFNNLLYVPLYGTDQLATYKFDNGRIRLVQLEQPFDSLDAPAGVSVFNKEIAIADFYNNRVLYRQQPDAEWLSIGKEGKAAGEFNYPTDVQLTKNYIWVADAYNHRVQIFDKKGVFQRMIGEDQKMNAATGIYVINTEVFVTDFENDRVLIFDKNGRVNQILTGHTEKPTDVLLWKQQLYVLNYKRSSISIFEYKSKLD